MQLTLTPKQGVFCIRVVSGHGNPGETKMRRARGSNPGCPRESRGD